MRRWANFFMVGVALSLSALIIGGLVLSRTVAPLADNINWTSHTYVVINQLENLFSAVQDAETGQRGYLLTGEMSYLTPYQDATHSIDQQLQDLQNLLVDNPTQEQNLNVLKPVISGKLGELQQTITLRQSQGPDAALQVVLTDQGQRLMNNIRDQIGTMQTEERDLLAKQSAMTGQTVQTTITVSTLIFFLSIAFLIATLLFLNWELRQHVQNEQALHAAQNSLERRVRERTAELEEANRRQTFLADASQALASTLDYAAMLQRVAALIVPKLADWCVLETFDSDVSQRQIAVAHVDSSKVQLIQNMRQRFPLDLHSEDAFAHALRHKKPTLAPEVSDTFLGTLSRNPEQVGVLRDLGVGSVMIVPLVAADQVLGTIAFVSSVSGRQYTPADLRLAEDLASRTAFAIENTRLYAEAQRARYSAEQNAVRIARYQLVLTALSEARTIDQVVNVIVQKGAGILGAVAGSVGLFTENGFTLEMVSASGYSEVATNNWRHVPINTLAPLSDAVRTQTPVWLPSREEAQARYPDNNWNLENRAAWAALPLIISGKMLGGMMLSFSMAQAFASVDQAFLMGMADKCAQALDRILLYREVSDQREQFRVTLASIGDAVIATDASGYITFINRVAQALTCWPDNSAIGEPLHEVFKIVDETTHTPVESPFTIVMREGGVVNLTNHTTLITKDRSELPIDDAGAPILDENNVIKGVVLVFRDITERRSQEAALQATLERTLDLYETCHQIGTVYSADEILKAQFTSRYFKHATQAAILSFDSPWEDQMPAHYAVIAPLNEDKPLPGFDEDGLLRNSPIASLLSLSRPVFVDDIQTDQQVSPLLRDSCLQTGIHSLILYPLLARNTCYGLLVTYFPAPHQWTEQDRRHLQTFVEQISVALDSVRLLEEEKRIRQEVERANQLQLKFLAMISHELRTPLTSIKGFASTLMATDVTWDLQEQRQFIVILDEEANKLTDLIEQLLDLSRLQAGQLRIQPVNEPLSMVFNTAQPQLNVMAAQHKLVIDPYTNLPWVWADTQRVAQVLVNLVGNAAKYSPVGSQIHISFAPHETSLQINVSDQGPGIAPEDREKVFELFSQLSLDEKQKMKGAGLGLAICKGLIEAHGGKIWIDSGPGLGTTVSFTLHLARLGAVSAD